MQQRGKHKTSKHGRYTIDCITNPSPHLVSRCKKLVAHVGILRELAVVSREHKLNLAQVPNAVIIIGDLFPEPFLLCRVARAHDFVPNVGIAENVSLACHHVLLRAAVFDLSEGGGLRELTQHDGEEDEEGNISL